MRISWKTIAGLVTLALTTSALVACGTVSHKVSVDGSGAEQLIWPAPNDVTPMHKGGTFPNMDSLRQLVPGLNKQQIANLIDAPHFSEGVWGVREWNYVFNFRDANSGQVTVCQHKILFDKDMLARSFYWSPEACGNLLNAGDPAAAKPQPSTGPQTVLTLSTDALFYFDKSATADIKYDGLQQLDAMADNLQTTDTGNSIHVIGYTDRLGSDEYNKALSQRRADSVMAYLVQKGVPSSRIVAEGRGAAAPVKTDCSQQTTVALVECLAPNRRVEVVVDGQH